MVVSHGQPLPEQRQHGRIGEMEEHRCQGKDGDMPRREELAQSRDVCLSMYRPGAPCLEVIDVLLADQEHHEYGSPTQGNDQIEDAFQREIIPDGASQERSAHVPRMIERFIAAHAICQLRGAYKPERDRGKGGWKDRGCTPDQGLCCEHPDQRGPHHDP